MRIIGVEDVICVRFPNRCESPFLVLGADGIDR